MEWVILMATAAGGAVLSAVLRNRVAPSARRLVHGLARAVRHLAWFVLWVTLPPGGRVVEFEDTVTVMEVTKNSRPTKSRRE